MAHGIMDTDQMFSVREKPWHGLGIIIEEPPETIEEVITVAGLDWSVEKRNVRTDLVVGGQIMDVPVPGAYSTIRMNTDGSEQILGSVGEKYTVIQNSEAVLPLGALISTGAATAETAGSLFNGRKCWTLLKVPGLSAEIVPGDEVNSYLLSSWSHDGNSSMAILSTAVRVVCSNTLTFALDAMDEKHIRIRHTKSAADEIAFVTEVMARNGAQFGKSVDAFRIMARKSANRALVNQFIEEVLPNPKGVDQPVSTRLTNIRGNVISLFDTISARENIAGVGGNVWGLYNSFSEYTDHIKGKDSEKRLDSQFFGASSKMKERAFEVALKLAA